MWQLPGPRRFVEEVAEVLSDGRHAIVVAPRVFDAAGLRGAIDRTLRDESGFGLAEVYPGDDEDAPLLDRLADAMGADPRRFCTVRDLLSYDAAPARVIAVDLRIVPPALQGDWSRLLALAGDMAQQVEGVPYLLLAFVAPSFPRPVENVFLRTLAWWGRIGAADVEAVAEELLRTCPPSTAALRVWGMVVTRALAPCDPDLAHDLLVALPTCVDGLTDFLRSRYSGPDLELNGYRPPSELLPLLGLSTIREPSRPDELVLWEHGLIDWQPGRGMLIDARLLAAAGRQDELDRRLWRAQQDVLLPIVEAVRSHADRLLVALCGEGWPRHFTGNSTHDFLAAVEIGEMCNLLCSRRGADPPVPDALLAALLEWRAIRNALSHGKLVDIESIGRALRTAAGMEHFTRSLAGTTK